MNKLVKSLLIASPCLGLTALFGLASLPHPSGVSAAATSSDVAYKHYESEISFSEFENDRLTYGEWSSSKVFDDGTLMFTYSVNVDSLNANVDLASVGYPVRSVKLIGVNRGGVWSPYLCFGFDDDYNVDYVSDRFLITSFEVKLNQAYASYGYDDFYFNDDGDISVACFSDFNIMDTPSSLADWSIANPILDYSYTSFELDSRCVVLGRLPDMPFLTTQGVSANLVNHWLGAFRFSYDVYVPMISDGGQIVVFDIWSLFGMVLTMPITFMSQFLNFEMFSGTAYAFVPSVIISSIFGILAIYFIVKLVVGFFK